MTSIKAAILATGLSTLALIATPAEAQRGWQTVGTLQVNGGLDRDTIAVRGNERFRAVRMCANRRAVRLIDADVEFANGGTQDLGAARLLSPGECTRPLQLNGRQRDIKRISLAYAKFRIFSRPPVLTVQAR